jgi:hypothetical protein
MQLPAFSSAMRLSFKTIKQASEVVQDTLAAGVQVRQTQTQDLSFKFNSKLHLRT